jgi:phage shock protein A
MSEGLIKRISRLVSASANSLVDSIESAAPQMVMEEAIREIEAATKDVRIQLGKLEASKYLSTQTLNKDNEKHAELQAQIEVAVQQSRDDLAEVAIAKQMDIEAMIPVIEKNIAEDDAEIKELESYISALQAKKREMEESLNEFIKASEHIDNSAYSDGGTSTNVSTRVDGATSVFNRVAGGAIGVDTNTKLADEKKLAELETLTRNNRIKERLAKVKTEAESE